MREFAANIADVIERRRQGDTAVAGNAAPASGTTILGSEMPDGARGPSSIYFGRYTGWGRDGSQAWLAPAGTSRAIRQQISKEMARNLALPKVKMRLQNMSFFIAPASPEEHEKNLRADIEIFSRLVKELGMTAK